MAVVSTYSGINMLKWDFSVLIQADYYVRLSDYFSARYSNGHSENLWGYGFTYDINGVPTGAGTVTAYSVNSSGNLLGTVTGFSIPASWVRDAAFTLSTADDMAVVRTVLAGADTVYGSGYSDLLDGFNGNDTIYGYAGNDTIYGEAGNDIMSGGAGNDYIDGGAGTDTAAYTGSRSQYSGTLLSNGQIQITGSVDGADNVQNVELFRFSDGTYTAAQIVAHSETVYDTDNQAYWQCITSSYDGFGRLDYVSVQNDNGSSQFTDYDQANGASWKSATAGYDSLSRLDTYSVQNDNGSFYWTDYDQANGASWNSATTGYDSLSRLDTYSVQNDNGSFSWTDYDQANGASWNSATAGYDSLSRLDYSSVQNDNGSSSWTDYDQANGASWNSATAGYDSLSRLDYLLRPERQRLVLLDRLRPGQWRVLEIRHCGLRQPEPPRLPPPSRTTTARSLGPTTTRPMARPGNPPLRATTA